MEWVGVDPLHQVVSRDAAMELIPWLSVRWQASPPESGHYFWWDDDGLALKSAAFDSRSSVHVDFVHGAQARRVKAVSGEALTRAMGCNKGLRPSIVDTTAGLGGDLSVLANVGCEVFAMERHPIVAALLQDGVSPNKTTTANRTSNAHIIRAKPASSRSFHNGRGKKPEKSKKDICCCLPVFCENSKMSIAKHG